MTHISGLDHAEGDIEPQGMTNELWSTVQDFPEKKRKKISPYGRKTTPTNACT